MIQGELQNLMSFRNYKTFKIGDKAIDNFGQIVTIVNLDVLDYDEMFMGRMLHFHYDCKVRHEDGREEKSELEKYFLADDMVLDIHGRKKWDVNEMIGDTEFKVPLDNGYYGTTTILQYKGKKCIVHCDGSDAKVMVRTDFFDDIKKLDYKYPSIVFDKERGYNIVMWGRHEILIDEWMQEIGDRWRWDGHSNILDGVTKDGRRVVIGTNGCVTNAEEATEEYIEAKLAEVKKYTESEIVEKWINAGKPCYFIRGLEYKGASAGRISKETALKYLPTHKAFDCMFNSAEWRVLNGAVALLFREYADSDYD